MSFNSVFRVLKSFCVSPVRIYDIRFYIYYTYTQRPVSIIFSQEVYPVGVWLGSYKLVLKNWFNFQYLQPIFMNEAQAEETAYARWVINWLLLIAVCRQYQVFGLHTALQLVV